MPLTVSCEQYLRPNLKCMTSTDQITTTQTFSTTYIENNFSDRIFLGGEFCSFQGYMRKLSLFHGSTAVTLGDYPKTICNPLGSDTCQSTCISGIGLNSNFICLFHQLEPDSCNQGFFPSRAGCLSNQ